MLRRAHPPGDHQLRRTRVAPTSRQGRGSHVHRRVPDPVRVVRRVRHAQGVGRGAREERIEHLEGRETDLERQVAELKARCDSIETREAERREEEEKRHAEEVGFMQKSNKQLKQQLEKFLSAEKNAK